MSTQVIIPSGVWASLIILSCPIITVYGLGDPGHSAICSDSIDAEIRGVGQEGAGTHMFGGRSGDASRVTFASGPAGSDGGEKMKGDAQSSSRNRKMTTS